MARYITNTISASIFGICQDQFGVAVTRNSRAKTMRLRFNSWHHDVVRAVDGLVLLAGWLLLGLSKSQKSFKRPATAWMAGRMPAYGDRAAWGLPCMCPVIS